jgi:hypothetical protein
VWKDVPRMNARASERGRTGMVRVGRGGVGAAMGRW